MSRGDRSLDVLFVNPGSHRRIYQNLGAELAAKEPPIWAAQLAMHARQRGRSVSILDANALDLTPEQIGTAVAELTPRLTVVVVYGHNPNASTFAMPGARDAIAGIRAADPEGRVLLLGGHVAALPERTLREEDVDFVCSGEGPYTIDALVDALTAERTRPELARVPGLLWRDGDAIVRNIPAPLVRDLDNEMPGMAWDLLDMTRYRAHNWHAFGRPSREPYAALYTTLGCPFQCTFCCIQAPFKEGEAAAGLDNTRNSYRKFDPDRVVADITRLVADHGVQNIKIADELFLLDRHHVTRICDGLAALDADLNIWAYARVDTCRDGELLAKMRAAGVRWLAIGIESASEKVRAGVDKGYKPAAMQKAISLVRDAGIAVMGNYIFGLPEDDQASMRLTLDFAKELNTEFANFFSAMAYPGSQLYRDAVANGWQLPADWDGYSQHSKSCLPLPTRHLAGAEVLAFRDAAFREYFDRDEYRAMAARTFGPAVLPELARMLGPPLPREHAAVIVPSAASTPQPV